MCGCNSKCGCNITSTTKGEKGDASPEATLGYKVYKALISQEAAGAPTAIVLVNTLGVVPTFAYTTTGEYVLTATGVFTVDKTFILTGSSVDAGCTVKITHSSVNDISIKTYDSGNSAKNTIITEYPILIEVYP